MNSKSLIIKQKLNPIHRLTLSRPKSSRIMNDDSVFADLIKMCNSYVRHILFTRGGGGQVGGAKCLSICIPPPPSGKSMCSVYDHISCDCYAPARAGGVIEGKS